MPLPLSQQSTINSIIGNLKEFYSGAKLWDEVWENNPALTRLNKEMDTCGAYYDFAVKYGGSQGMGINFANAYANQTPELYMPFHVPVNQMIKLTTLQNSALRAAAMKGPGALEGLLEGAIRTGIKDVTNEFARAMFAGGTATIGQIATATNGAVVGSNTLVTVVLTSSLAYQFFEPNESLDATLTDGGAPLQTVSGVNDVGTVNQIDAAAGVLVLSVPTADLASFVAGNFLIRDGNYVSTGFSGSITTAFGGSAFNPVAVAGLGLWCPSAASRAAGVLNVSFCGAQRSADGTRLGGISVNATGASIQAGLIQCARALHMFGHAGPYDAYMNPNTHAALAESMQGQRLYQGTVEDGDVSFDTIEVLGGPGKIRVILDRNVPAFTTFVVKDGAMRMVSMGAPFELLEYPGMPGGYIWPLQDQDAVQVRIGGYPQLIVDDPTGIANLTTSQ